MRSPFLSLAALALAPLLAAGAALPAPEPLEERSSGTLTAAQVAAFKPYTHYAGAAACEPAATRAWTCGRHCTARPGFTPIASGGNGATTQYWYVGYDSALQSAIVGFQGTDAAKILPLITNANFNLRSLDSALFPGVASSVKVHDGFGDAQERSATAVLSAVRTVLARYGVTKVAVVGHSLGGAIATISALHLAVNLPAGTAIKGVTYGMPRVGNAAFANLVNARAVLNRINNQDDIVPIVPGRFMGFAHTEGELHILNNNAWVNCPGQDNTDADCTIGYVPNLWSGEPNDHGGPYGGVSLGC